MRVDLSARQWLEPEQGEILGPDGFRYARRTTRTKRREVDDLIGAGSPLVLYYWAGGQLEWFDGEDAEEQWRLVRPAVVSQESVAKREIEWTAGRWEELGGKEIVVLNGRC